MVVYPSSNSGSEWKRQKQSEILRTVAQALYGQRYPLPHFIFIFVRDGILSVADYNSSGMGVVVVGVVVGVIVGVVGTFHDGIT